MNDNVPICSFCAATVKPDVVFFGEDLPQKYFLHTEDFPKADLLIIMGTSLQVNSLNIYLQYFLWVFWCILRAQLYLNTVSDWAVCQPGEHGALHCATPPPQPTRRGSLWEGPSAERRPHGAGWPGGYSAEVCRNAWLERWDRKADEDSGNTGGFHLKLQAWKNFLQVT